MGMKEILASIALVGVLGIGGCQGVSDEEIDLRVKHQMYGPSTHYQKSLPELQMWNQGYEYDKKIREEREERMNNDLRRLSEPVRPMSTTEYLKSLGH